MIVNFHFDIAPISTNKLIRVVKGRPIKSADARLFNSNIQQLLRWGYNNQCIELNAAFDPLKHRFKLDFIFTTPKLYKKKGGGISAHSGDVDNYMKQYIDSVFNHIGINDVFITEIHAIKRHGQKLGVDFRLELLDKD